MICFRLLQNKLIIIHFNNIIPFIFNTITNNINNIMNLYVHISIFAIKDLGKIYKFEITQCVICKRS